MANLSKPRQERDADRVVELPVFGHISLGTLTQSDPDDIRTRRVANTPHFHVHFNPGHEGLADVWAQVYGENVQVIDNAFLIAWEIVWEDFDNQKNLKHRCDGSETQFAHRDYKTQRLVRNPIPCVRHHEDKKLRCACKERIKMRLWLPDICAAARKSGTFALVNGGQYNINDAHSAILRVEYELGDAVGKSFALWRYEKEIDKRYVDQKTGESRYKKAMEWIMGMRPSDRTEAEILQQQLKRFGLALGSGGSMELPTSDAPLGLPDSTKSAFIAGSDSGYDESPTIIYREADGWNVPIAEGEPPAQTKAHWWHDPDNGTVFRDDSLGDDESLTVNLNGWYATEAQAQAAKAKFTKQASGNADIGDHDPLELLHDDPLALVPSDSSPDANGGEYECIRVRAETKRYKKKESADYTEVTEYTYVCLDNKAFKFTGSEPLRQAGYDTDEIKRLGKQDKAFALMPPAKLVIGLNRNGVLKLERIERYLSYWLRTDERQKWVDWIAKEFNYGLRDIEDALIVVDNAAISLDAWGGSKEAATGAVIAMYYDYDNERAEQWFATKQKANPQVWTDDKIGLLRTATVYAIHAESANRHVTP